MIVHRSAHNTITIPGITIQDLGQAFVRLLEDEVAIGKLKVINNAVTPISSVQQSLQRSSTETSKTKNIENNTNRLAIARRAAEARRESDARIAASTIARRTTIAQAAPRTVRQATNVHWVCHRSAFEEWYINMYNRQRWIWDKYLADEDEKVHGKVKLIRSKTGKSIPMVLPGRTVDGVKRYRHARIASRHGLVGWLGRCARWA